MVNQAALKLNSLELLLIGSIAISALWIGRAVATPTTLRVIGQPVPNTAFEIQHGVPLIRDSLATIDTEQKGLRIQLAITQILLLDGRQRLTRASGVTKKILEGDINNWEQSTMALQRKQDELTHNQDTADLTLAAATAAAGVDVAHSASFRRLGSWAIETACCLIAFLLLMGLLCAITRWIRITIHLGAVAIGALIILVGLLLVAYLGWVSIALLAVVAVLMTVRGRRLDTN
jgi:hypothetical protein